MRCFDATASPHDRVIHVIQAMTKVVWAYANGRCSARLSTVHLETTTPRSMSSPTKRRDMDIMKLMMSDYEVTTSNDSMQEMYVKFHGPKESTASFKRDGHGRRPQVGGWQVRTKVACGRCTSNFPSTTRTSRHRLASSTEFIIRTSTKCTVHPAPVDTPRSRIPVDVFAREFAHS